MKKMNELKGRLILFQEERIRMVDERGVSFLFDLDHSLPVSAGDLQEWIRQGAQLVVSYSGEPETETGVVHSVKKAA